MSRHDTRRAKHFLRLAKPYAAKLSAFCATLSSPPTNVTVAAQLMLKKTGVKPPVPWEVLPQVVRFNTAPRKAPKHIVGSDIEFGDIIPVEGLPVPNFKKES